MSGPILSMSLVTGVVCFTVLTPSFQESGQWTEILISKVVSTHLWNTPRATFTNRLFHGIPFIVGIAGGLPLPGVRYPHDSGGVWVAPADHRSPHFKANNITSGKDKEKRFVKGLHEPHWTKDKFQLEALNNTSFLSYLFTWLFLWGTSTEVCQRGRWFGPEKGGGKEPKRWELKE